MKLKHIRRITYGLFASVILFFCLMYVHPAFGVGGIAAFIVLAIFNLAYYRCPHCSGHLGREVGKYCQHCGEKLEQN